MTVRRRRFDLIACFSLTRLVTQYKYTLICGCGWMLMFMPVITFFNVHALTQMDSSGVVNVLVFDVFDDALLFQQRYCFEFFLVGCLVALGGFMAWRIDVEKHRISEMGAVRRPDQS